jgi:hypothetical protein
LIFFPFVDQAQRAILGLTDDTVTQLQQQIKHAEQAIQEKKELKKKIQIGFKRVRAIFIGI